MIQTGHLWEMKEMAERTRKILVLNSENQPVLRAFQASSSSEVPKVGELSVFLLLDCSGSMAGDPLCQMKSGAIDFAESAHKKGYRIGLISFDSMARVLADPTGSLVHLKPKINSLYSTGSTNMTHAIRLGLEKLESFPDLRCIVLITDGSPDDRRSTLQAAQDAKNAGIDIITIGTESADHAFLKEMASARDLALATTTDRLSLKLASTANLLPLPKPRP